MQKYFLLEKSKVENLHELVFGGEFSDTTLKAWFMKEKIRKSEFIKIKTFCSV